MDLDHDPDHVITVLDDVLGVYEEVQDADDISAMAAEDFNMKATALRAIKRDVEQHA